MFKTLMGFALGWILALPALTEAAESSARVPAARPEPIPEMYIVRVSVSGPAGESALEVAPLAGLPFELDVQGESELRVAAPGASEVPTTPTDGIHWLRILTPPTPGLDVYDHFAEMDALRPAQSGAYAEEALARIKAQAPWFTLGDLQLQLYAPDAERLVLRVWRIDDDSYFAHKNVAVDHSLPYAERLRQQGYTYVGTLDCALTCPDLGPLPIAPVTPAGSGV